MESSNAATIIGSISGKFRLSYVIEYAVYYLLNLARLRVYQEQVCSNVCMVRGYEDSEDVDFHIEAKSYQNGKGPFRLLRFSEDLKFRSTMSREFLDILASDCHKKDEVIKAFGNIKDSIQKFDKFINQIFKISTIVTEPYLRLALNLPLHYSSTKEQRDLCSMIILPLEDNPLTKVLIIKSVVYAFQIPPSAILPDGYFEDFYMRIGQTASSILSYQDKNGDGNGSKP